MKVSDREIIKKFVRTEGRKEVSNRVGKINPRDIHGYEMGAKQADVATN